MKHRALNVILFALGRSPYTLSPQLWNPTTVRSASLPIPRKEFSLGKNTYDENVLTF